MLARIFALLAAAALFILPASADVAVTAGSGTTVATQNVGGGSQAAQVIPTDSASVKILYDPCHTIARTTTPILVTTATNARLIAPTSAKKTYICSLFLSATAADNVAIVEGTGGTCSSGTAAVLGGTTTANGVNLTANQGFSLPATGYAHMWTVGTNVDFCVITSSTGPLVGVVTWVQN